MGQETQQPLQPRVGVLVDMFRHLVIHKGIVLVADDAPRISHLGDIARALTLVRATSMPHLIIESGSEVLLCLPLQTDALNVLIVRFVFANGVASFSW